MPPLYGNNWAEDALMKMLAERMYGNRDYGPAPPLTMDRFFQNLGDFLANSSVQQGLSYLPDPGPIDPSDFLSPLMMAGRGLDMALDLGKAGKRAAKAGEAAADVGKGASKVQRVGGRGVTARSPKGTKYMGEMIETRTGAAPSSGKHPELGPFGMLNPETGKPVMSYDELEQVLASPAAKQSEKALQDEIKRHEKAIAKIEKMEPVRPTGLGQATRGPGKQTAARKAAAKEVSQRVAARKKSAARTPEQVAPDTAPVKAGKAAARKARPEPSIQEQLADAPYQKIPALTQTAGPPYPYDADGIDAAAHHLLDHIVQIEMEGQRNFKSSPLRYDEIRSYVNDLGDALGADQLSGGAKAAFLDDVEERLIRRAGVERLPISHGSQRPSSFSSSLTSGAVAGSMQNAQQQMLTRVSQGQQRSAKLLEDVYKGKKSLESIGPDELSLMPEVDRYNIMVADRTRKEVDISLRQIDSLKQAMANGAISGPAAQQALDDSYRALRQATAPLDGTRGDLIRSSMSQADLDKLSAAQEMFPSIHPVTGRPERYGMNFASVYGDLEHTGRAFDWLGAGSPVTPEEMSKLSESRRALEAGRKFLREKPGAALGGAAGGKAAFDYLFGDQEEF